MKSNALLERIRLLSFPNKAPDDKDIEKAGHLNSISDKTNENSPPATAVGDGEKSNREQTCFETISIQDEKAEDFEKNLHSLARNHDSTELEKYLKDLVQTHQLTENNVKDSDSEDSHKEEFNRQTFLRKILNEKDEEGMTPLHYAARYNNEKSVPLLVQYGANVNAHDLNNATPLHAVARGRKIISKPIDDFAQQNPNETAIRLADETARIQDGFTVDETDIAKENIIRYLLANQANPIEKDKYGSTPLHYAAMRGNVVAAKVLVELDRNDIINAKDDQQSTPLHLACSYKWMLICKLLVKHKADVFAKDARSYTPLQFAVMEGTCDIMELLLNASLEQGGSVKAIQYVNEQNFDRDTPLFIAIVYGHLDAAKLLLDKGANLMIRHKDRNSCLHKACYRSNVEMLKLLLDHGANANWKNDSDETPLHTACDSGLLESVRFFLSHNANIEARDKLSRTPLLVAVQSKASNSCEIIKLLLNKKAKLHTTDKFDRTPVWLAAKANKADVIDLLLEKDECPITPGLAGINTDMTNKPDRKNNTPLHVAAKLGHLQAFESLLRKGAGLDLKNEDEKTPLHLAAANGHVKIVELILQLEPQCYDLVRDEDENSNTPLHLAAGAGKDDVIKRLILYSTEVFERKNAQRLTPLACAAAKGHKSTVQLLIDCGATVNMSDIKETTALHLACEMGKRDIVYLLLENGARSDYVDSKGRNCLDLAIECGQSEIATVLINDKNYGQALKQSKTVKSLGRETRSTPMRELISKMPDVARLVLDKCVTVNCKDKSKTYNFELVDDVYSCWSFESEYKDNVDAKTLSPRTKQKIKANDPMFNSYDKTGRLLPSAKLYSKNLEEIKENHPLMLMVNSENEQLLSHELVSTLLAHKWESYGRYIYYFGLTIYITFVAFLTDFAINSPPPYNFRSDFYDLPTDFCFNRTLSENYSNIIPKIEARTRFSQYMTVIFASINLFKEFGQLYYRRKRYFVWQSLIEVTIYVCSFLFTIDWTDCARVYGYRLEEQWLFGVTATVLAWLDLVLILRKFPTLGIYVVMFIDVFRTFSKFFVVFFLFIVAFAIAFFMMFQNQHLWKRRYELISLPFSTFPTTIVKTVVMMVGEFEYNAMFYSSPLEHVGNPIYHATLQAHLEKSYYPATAQAVFLIFSIIMTILIMNLLIGLAVDDIKEVQSKAVIKRLAMKVELVLEIEFIAPEFIRRKWVVGRKTVPLTKPPGFTRFLYLLWPKSKSESPEDVYNAMFGEKSKEEALKLEQDVWGDECMEKINYLTVLVETTITQQRLMSAKLDAFINQLSAAVPQQTA